MAMAKITLQLHSSNSELRHGFISKFNPFEIVTSRNSSIKLAKTIRTNFSLTVNPLYLSATSSMLFFQPFKNVHGILGKSLMPRVKSPITPICLPLDLLDSWEDEYNGVVIDPHSLPASTNAFVSLFRASHSYWKQNGKKGVWLKIFSNQANLVPVAITEGFCFHHAEPGFVMLTYWIPEGPCLLPVAASHHVGVAGFVLNDNAEVLVVKEKHCPCHCSGMWKLPTGFLNKSEDLFSGVVREVEEETGIRTSFMEVVTFRHAHHMTFENSDLLFLCMLKPLSLEVKIDEGEIEAAMWMPLVEFLEQPFYQEDCMSKKMIDICMARYENCFSGLTPNRLFSQLDNRSTYVYCHHY